MKTKTLRTLATLLIGNNELSGLFLSAAASILAV